MRFIFGRRLEARNGMPRLPACPGRAASACVPRLEALEDRTVPSTLTVPSAADDGSAGTLRAIIADAQSGDIIRFAPSLAGQTITLTSGELAINKSLTINGPGCPADHQRQQRQPRLRHQRQQHQRHPRRPDHRPRPGRHDHGNRPFGNVALGGAILNTGAHVSLSGVTMMDSQANATQTGYVQTNLVSDLATKTPRSPTPTSRIPGASHRAPAARSR